LAATFDQDVKVGLNLPIPAFFELYSTKRAELPACTEQREFMRQSFNTTNFSPEELNRFYEYDVFDHEEHHMGNITGLWEDHTGKPSFVGVKTAWLFGKTHVIPLHAAQVDAEEGHVYVPYSEEQIKNAPTFDTDAELDTNKEQEVYTYYGVQAPTARAPISNKAAAQAPAPAPSETATMALHEEQLKVGKREVESGVVRLRKIIRTEIVNQPVELKREDVVVERVPASEAKETGQPYSGQEQVIPLHREEAVIQKETNVREGVRVRKTEQTEKQNLSEQIRKEDVEVLQGQNQGEERRINSDKS
jgi:uncharacterized protein (TIGR02271 family)